MALLGVVSQDPRRRVSLRDVLALLLIVGWCVLGIAKIGHDVSEYRAQQAAIAAFHARYPDAALHAFVQSHGGAAEISYDPALGRWLVGETVGYLLTLLVVLIGRRGTRDTGVTAEVRWTGPSRDVSGVVLNRPREALIQSGSMAAERVSVIVWNDRVARLEKEHA